MTTETLISTESNTVTGDAFYNRIHERQYICEKIKNGEHLLLTGQRRMGKSSLAREIGRMLMAENSNWSFIFVDIQACASGAELIARLAESIYKQPGFSNQVKAWFSPIFSGIKNIEEISTGEFSITLRQSLNKGNWQNKGRELLQKIEADDKRTLLVLDEFPDVVNKIYRKEGVDEVEALLDWLRSETQATVHNKKISLIISGSIGLEPVLQRLKLITKINHLATYRLKPWKRNIAKNCFYALANYQKIPIEEDAIEYFLDHLGIYIPAHIQKCWARLYSYLQEEELTSATRLNAEHVFQKIILRSDSDSMIRHYEDRLQETLGECDYLIAIKLLDKMCDGTLMTPRKISIFKKKQIEDIDIHYIVSVLHHDGYLESINDDWMFSDSLLRTWWKKRKVLR